MFLIDKTKQILKKNQKFSQKLKINNFFHLNDNYSASVGLVFSVLKLFLNSFNELSASLIIYRAFIFLDGVVLRRSKELHFSVFGEQKLLWEV